MSERFPQYTPEIGPNIEEEKEPMKNAVELFEKIFYASGVITHASKFNRSEEHPNAAERPMFARTRRAKLFNKIKSETGDNVQYKEGAGINFSDLKSSAEEKDFKKNILEEARLRDLIDQQTLNQHEFSINLPNYGEQKARMIDITPPAELITEKTKDLPPIFLIPGLSNDIECITNLAAELAYDGRRVVSLAYPESMMAQTTEEFAQAVESDPSFEPHVQFFGAMVDHLTKDNKNIELWGYSTGAPIAAGILKNEKYQQSVDNAVLLCSAASVEQKPTSVKIGAAKEIGYLKDNGFDAGASFHFMGVGFNQEPSKKQSELHDKIFATMLNKISHANEDWKDAKVRENGNILVVSGEKDQITKSVEMNDEFSKDNNQIRTLTIPDGYHSTPLMEPENVLPKIFEKQE